MDSGTRICVWGIYMPWEICSPLGEFATYSEADAAASACVKWLASDGQQVFHTMIDADGMTGSYVTDGEGSDTGEGYLFVTRTMADSQQCLVYRQSLEGGDEILGPFRDADDANARVFGEHARKKFRIAPGTFGPVYYAVDRTSGPKEGHYQLLCRQ